MWTDNHALVDRYFDELINGRRFQSAGEIIAPNFTFYSPSQPQGRTIVGLAEFINELRAAFSDKHFEEIERIVTEACVVSRFRMTGTHDGSFHGFPPTGKPTEVEGCDLIYIQDGRIVAVRAYFDYLTLLKQVGALPQTVG